MNSWLLLLHQIPPSPPYLRAKVMRRLNELGAMPVKNSAYLLPANDDTLEDLQWLRREVEQGGGEAWLFRSEPLAGLSNESLQEEFRKLRSADFRTLAGEARMLLEELRAAPEKGDAQIRKLKRRFDDLRRIDFYGAPGREEVEVLMKEIDRTVNAPRPPAGAGAAASGEYTGRTWVTRRGVKVDRMASAWLIRRSIDPPAHFVFVDPQNYQHGEREIRFDMFEGELTHDGDLCTFEVLLRFLGAAEPALAAVAEVVHDLDLKDNKYQRPETAGIGLLIDGIALRHADDQRRIEEGAAIFEALYAQYRGGGKP